MSFIQKLPRFVVWWAFPGRVFPVKVHKNGVFRHFAQVYNGCVPRYTGNDPTGTGRKTKK